MQWFLENFCNFLWIKIIILVILKRNCNLNFHKSFSDYNFKNSNYIKNVLYKKTAVGIYGGFASTKLNDPHQGLKGSHQCPKCIFTFELGASSLKFFWAKESASSQQSTAWPIAAGKDLAKAIAIAPEPVPKSAHCPVFWFLIRERA